MNSTLKTILINKVKEHWPFCFAFLLMVIYLKNTGSMLIGSTDASSIWETIKSFHTEEIIPSYVLYKGFASVYPYEWLYRLSLFFNLDEFFFVKLFHCILFSYITAVGFPSIIKNLLNIKIYNYRKLIFIIITFFLWEPNGALRLLMIDLPCLAYFLLLINSAMRIKVLKHSKSKINHLILYLYSGLLIGLNICASGQYSLAAFTLLLFIVINTIFKQGLRGVKLKAFPVICLIFMVIMIMGVYETNRYFEKEIVDPLRAQGEWIPTGEEWLHIGLNRFSGLQRNAEIKIPETRGLSIFQDIYKDDYEEMKALSENGAIYWSISEYFTHVFDYPLDYLARYGNRLFLMASPDRGALNFAPLFISYSLIFLSFLSIKNRCKKVGDFFSTKLLIIISFIFCIAAPMAMLVELRYAMQIQGLVYAVAIMDNQIWSDFILFKKNLIKCHSSKTANITSDQQFPLTILAYLGFLFLCFIHIASLYEMIGVSPDVLFKFR